MLVGMQTDAATMENSMEFPQKKLKMQLPFDPAIPLLGLYPKNPETPSLCSRKKELLPSETAWMELESIMLSEISQVVKDKYRMISPLSGT